MNTVSEIRYTRSAIPDVSRKRGNQQSAIRNQHSSLRIALLTGGGDKPYALGMAAALTSAGIHIDFVGSDELSVPELHGNPQVTFLNLRGDQCSKAGLISKVLRVLNYYVRLIRYAARAEPKVFHILWNNKFEFFDRTLLMAYYKLLRKRLVFTAHNVNASKRDSNDSWLNRLSLRAQYALSDHIFVHTKGMKKELFSDFGVPQTKVSVIPFGINNTVPNTTLSSVEAKRRLGISSTDKAILFFGNIAPYKGLEYLTAAFTALLAKDQRYCLIIAGRIKGPESYWRKIQQAMKRDRVAERVIVKIEYVPDDETELYFKAADVLVLPYTNVFQSGVLFLAYSFGLPCVAADVGNLKEEIVAGQAGVVFKSQDSSDLARKIGEYFDSELFRSLKDTRMRIKAYGNRRYSWGNVAASTATVYSELLTARF
jgi:D-inositol-3-phosphate glycosyltransferase